MPKRWWRYSWPVLAFLVGFCLTVDFRLAPGEVPQAQRTVVEPAPPPPSIQGDTFATKPLSNAVGLVVEREATDPVPPAAPPPPPPRPTSAPAEPMARVGTVVVSTSKAFVPPDGQGSGTLQKAEEVSANATRTSPIWREDDLHDNEEEEEEEEELDSMSALLLTIGNLTFEPKILRPITLGGPPPPPPPQQEDAGAEARGNGESVEGGEIAVASITATPPPLPSFDPTPLPLRKRKDLPALAAGGVSAADVAVAVLHNIAQEDARNTYASLRASWIRHFPSTMMYVKHRQGSLAFDYLNLLKALRKKFPGKKWYLMVHDDTFVYGSNLLNLLASYDHNKPLVLGSTHCRGPNFRCASGAILSAAIPAAGGKDWLGWASGGSGIVVSGKAAKSLNTKGCLGHYSKKWDYRVPAADVVFSCCARDSGVVKVHNAGFVNGKPGFHECQCQDKGLPQCTLGGSALNTNDPLFRRRLTYHHVPAAMMKRLFVEEMASLSDRYGKRIGVFDLDEAKVIHVKQQGHVQGRLNRSQGLWNRIVSRNRGQDFRAVGG